MMTSCTDSENPAVPQVEGRRESSSDMRSVQAIIDSEYIDICSSPGSMFIESSEPFQSAGYLIFDPENDCCEDVDLSRYTVSPSQPDAVELINQLKGFVDEGYFEFINDNMAFALSRKLTVVISMIERGKINGALNKLSGDIQKHIKKWIFSETKQQEALAFLELVEWLILNPNSELYLPEELVNQYLEAISSMNYEDIGCRNTCIAVCTVATWNLGGCILLCVVLCPEPI